MRAILIGYGEIGKAVYNNYKPYHEIHIVDKKEPKKVVYLDTYDIMLIAIPYTSKFTEVVGEYKKRFGVKNIVVFSTVPVGTTQSLDVNAVHVPIEGKHPNLTESINKWQVYMGGCNSEIKYFFEKAKRDIIQLDSSQYTEFLKLQSTTNYGLMIEYARYVNEVCKQLGLDYKHVMDYNQAYNTLYKDLGNDNIKRYILTPPKGEIGGHCVVPNAKILQEQYPSVLVRQVFDRSGS